MPAACAAASTRAGAAWKCVPGGATTVRRTGTTASRRTRSAPGRHRSSSGARHEGAGIRPARDRCGGRRRARRDGPRRLGRHARTRASARCGRARERRAPPRRRLHALARRPRARPTVARRRAGEDFAGVRARLGDPEIAPLPDALLSPAKLLDHLGPTALRAALELEAGAVSDPVRSATGYHVLQVVEREAEWVPPREEIGDEVVAEYRRRRGEPALRAYLDGLRARADVEIAPSLR